MITANGSYKVIGVGPNERVALMIGLYAGVNRGAEADWWVLALGPSAIWSFDLVSLSWQPGVRPTYQGGLFDIPLMLLSTLTNLGPGTYTFAFAVDGKMDGEVTFDKLSYEWVTVKVTEP